MSHLVARTQAIPIDAVECSPHHASQSLLAYSAGQRITVSQWSADPDDDGAGKPIAAGIRALRDIRHFHVGTRTEDMSWAPTTSVDQQLIRLSLAGADFAIRILEAQLASNTYNIAAAPLEGHTGHINALEYSPGSGEFIASVSDDQTLRIWDVGNQQQHSCFELDSAGASVAWESSDGMDGAATPLQVMVAERSGLIRFFSFSGGEFSPFLTVQTDDQPLTSACLCRGNPNFIAAAVNGQWALWNRQKSPLESARAKKVWAPRCGRQTPNTYQMVSAQQRNLLDGQCR